MTVISKYLLLGCVLFTLSSCGTPTQKKETFYTVKTKFASNQFEDCSLTVLTMANHDAEVKSGTDDSLCGLKVRIKKVEGRKFLMSLKVELSDKDTSHKFNSKVIGVLGESMTLTQQKSKLDDVKYTFLIEETKSL